MNGARPTGSAFCGSRVGKQGGTPFSQKAGNHRSFQPVNHGGGTGRKPSWFSSRPSKELPAIPVRAGPWPRVPGLPSVRGIESKVPVLRMKTTGVLKPEQQHPVGMHVNAWLKQHIAPDDCSAALGRSSFCFAHLLLPVGGRPLCRTLMIRANQQPCQRRLLPESNPAHEPERTSVVFGF